ncbi:MAG TPA: transglutaminase family protein [Armatimonadota bacterium]|nr:transglutaminase family protein [Armatimonadota bacterium]
MKFQILHVTRYVYPSPVRASYNEVRIMPATDDRQICHSFELATTPAAKVLSYESVNGRVHHFDVRAAHTELKVEGLSQVITQPGTAEWLARARAPLTFYQDPTVQQRYAEYLQPTPQVPLRSEVDDFAATARQRLSNDDGAPAGGAGPWERDVAPAGAFLLALTRTLQSELSYTRGATTVDTSLEQVLEHRSGVCQDFAHVMLAACRRQQIPARYVSGYLFTGDTEAIRASDETISPSASASFAASPAVTDEEAPRESLGGWSGGPANGDAMHAWVECLLPCGQWQGFDPTNGVVVDESYVKAQAGLDYGEVSPFKGVYDGPLDHWLEVSVRVTRQS